MSFAEAAVACMEKYATPLGRARRAEFWWFFLLVQLVVIPLHLTSVILMNAAFPAVDSSDEMNWILFYVGFGLLVIVTMALAVPLLTAMVRRLHDRGLSGHFTWLVFIGLGIVPLVLCALPGTTGENRYGEDPRLAA
ncbi:DUF805 domain-containing protein [Demequina sediminicola]|uniref:DUF805 domain-containing protein n=1 Tax=Demequina sediminicola TaxID=1095026 RepID=UPI00078202BE|nr:DUF805 domain-containing protein [Demequina sediminicola]